jgi:hypothetical protein
MLILKQNHWSGSFSTKKQKILLNVSFGVSFYIVQQCYKRVLLELTWCFKKIYHNKFIDYQILTLWFVPSLLLKEELHLVFYSLIKIILWKIIFCILNFITCVKFTFCIWQSKKINKNYLIIYGVLIIFAFNE